jgi:hypothetical protein
MFRHYRVIFRELVFITPPSYISISTAAVGTKGAATPLQAWTGLEGSRRLRLPDFKTIGT